MIRAETDTVNDSLGLKNHDKLEMGMKVTSGFEMLLQTLNAETTEPFVKQKSYSTTWHLMTLWLYQQIKRSQAGKR